MTVPGNEAAAAKDLTQLGLYLVNADTGDVNTVLLHYTFETVSFAPNGRRLVFTGRAGDAPANGAVPTKMWTINADGSGLTQIGADNQYPEGPSWSPNGQSIAYYAYPVNTDGDEALYLLDTATNTHRLLGYVDQGRFPLEWSPDGSQIAFVSPNHRTITVIDVATAAKTETPVPIEVGAINGPNDLNELSWSSDGRQLIGSYGSGPVVVTDASGGNLRVLNADGRYAQASPTAALASEWVNFSTYLQPLAGGPARMLAPGYDPLDWSHDGRLIAGETGGKTIAAIDATTGLAHELIQETTNGASPAGWSPAGHVFALIVEQASLRRY